MPDPKDKWEKYAEPASSTKEDRWEQYAEKKKTQPTATEPGVTPFSLQSSGTQSPSLSQKELNKGYDIKSQFEVFGKPVEYNWGNYDNILKANSDAQKKIQIGQDLLRTARIGKTIKSTPTYTPTAGLNAKDALKESMQYMNDFDKAIAQTDLDNADFYEKQSKELLPQRR